MNDTTHAVMFHHFHDEVHPRGQGSIGSDDFNRILDWLGKHYRLINAKRYFRKAIKGELDPSEICLSFDDALLCQYDIALPILRERGIGAFFFIYSSPMKGEPDNLEIFRYFRNVEFSTIDSFYNYFFAACKKMFTSDYMAAVNRYDSNKYLHQFPFYTENDKWFRYLRDEALGKEKYEQLLYKLIIKKQFNPDKIMHKLWMNEDHIIELYQDGHVIGLHSYSHPTNLDEIPYREQLNEFDKNYKHLCKLIEKPIQAVSYPCGRYNDDTLNILNKMGIRVGFCSSMRYKKMKSLLEIPREDHANVLQEMAK